MVPARRAPVNFGRPALREVRSLQGIPGVLTPNQRFFSKMNRHYPQTHLPSGSLHSFDREHDACGVGFVAQIDGVSSHQILQFGIQSVCNVTHRGALDADGKTGDGAGVSTQIPHKLLALDLEKWGVRLEDPSALAVGMCFLPRQDEAQQLKAKVLAEGVLRNRGVRIYGWREVPVNPNELGEKALATRPEIRQLLVGRPEGEDGDAFERTLFLARREIEMKSKEEGIVGFYIASLSARLLSYKGLMVATALDNFYEDLANPDYETAICLYHQRFSTNTFPTWSLGQPFRMLAHNGEINTLRGNRNWFNSRASDFAAEVECWLEKNTPLFKGLLDPEASDSASLDGALELLVLSGRGVEHSMAMLIPPAWRIDPFTSEEEKAFYQYHRCFSEPWDGPAAVAFSDGMTVAATLDRNGLRPMRFKMTEDGIFTVGSEVGVIDLDDAKVIRKGRLAPGEMVSVDTRAGKVRSNKAIKSALAARKPYGEWLKKRIDLDDHVSPDPDAAAANGIDPLTRWQLQTTHAYNDEELSISITPMIQGGQEAVHSMGDDTPLSVLSYQPRLLYTYFKQLFAQVTNPPIDPIRERLVMSLNADLGKEGNLLIESPEHARVIHLESPFLFPHQFDALKRMDAHGGATVLDTTWPAADGAEGLDPAVRRLCEEAEAACDAGSEILILSDRAASHERVAMPALMATGAVHHHLIRKEKRMRVSLVMEAAEPRDTHQMASLFGYGITAICPYLAYQTVGEVFEKDRTARKPQLDGVKDVVEGLKNYRSALEKGVLKIMSKVGISVLNSYQGAQIFEAVGISEHLIQTCFEGTPSQLGGVDFEDVARESLMRHDAAYGGAVPEDLSKLKLGDPGFIRWRRNGEIHAVANPLIKNFHTFVRDNDPEKYKKYVDDIMENRPVALHDMWEIVPAGDAISVDDVEPIEDIRVRFTTAAMSLGALSPEAHETLAIAMNRIGGKSDSGEGGESAERFNSERNSRIKQVASGRFGVHAEYLSSADEIEIKMAQGAKPGEGGQLPGHKVSGIIAKLRHTQPGVTLISPPPHHDIYSIEDLAQLIHDLKEVNPRARVCVKLVAETGVGTIAAGVAKANADIILVSGHDGGTGASPLSSIKHAGLPWELGIAETQQVLMLNGLRDRVTLRTDGGLRNGRDIIMAALLGAEEYNFGTIALIAMGCVYVRQCHLNTCPVGVATQQPHLRDKFKGTPEHVINFFNAVAHEAREIMASLGARRLNDLIGHPELIRVREIEGHPKANKIDFSRLLKDVAAENHENYPRHCKNQRNDGNHARPLDDKILQDARLAIRDQTPVNLFYKVKNTNRNVGTKLAGEIAYHLGNHGLPDETITINLRGSAGQSFGTFLCGGVKLILTGEANDYVGKGMAGGEIVIKAPAERGFLPAENSIIGNTVMYGATGGRLFANGRAGERFCVRNSGGVGVVEGCGDHGCEYMTNGLAIILGPVGKNFGAGMSGGVAYVYDEEGVFERLFNPEMVEAHRVEDPEDEKLLQGYIYQHIEKTESEQASAIMTDWASAKTKFVKVAPIPPTPPAGEDDESKGTTSSGKEEAATAK